MSDTPQDPTTDSQLWDALYELFDKYCLPQFQAGTVVGGLRQTLAHLHQREQERSTLEAELQTYRQLALTLQNRLDGAK